jgi:hypothetical protein
MPTRMSRTGRYATVTALAALVLGACASNDADRGDVVDALTEAGVPDSQAECAGDRFEEQFTQDELNDIADIESTEDIPNDQEELWAEVDTILSECIGGEEPADEGTETTESTESGDSTETTDTTASGEPSESSTTTAGE